MTTTTGRRDAGLFSAAHRPSRVSKGAFTRRELIDEKHGAEFRAGDRSRPDN